VTYLAKLKFGAVSGDVLGASNELARCATLLVWALI
jgi:cobalamin synthase